MKRTIVVLISLTLIILVLSSCDSGNKTETNKPAPTICYYNPELYTKPIIEEFITKMYAIENYKNIDIENLNTNYPKDNYTNALRKIATENALEPFIANRIQLLYISTCYNSHINSEITSKNINKRSTEKDGSIVYDYDAKVKLTFIDENAQKEEDFKGQITLNKIDGNWTIIKFNNISVNIVK